MRRYILGGLATLGAVCAHAQSSITLYGIVDAGVAWTNNTQIAKSAGGLTGASTVSFADGLTAGLAGSRWGFHGVEDLGGGLKTVFTLENGFTVNNGALTQGGAEFGRQAFVGLDSSRLGTLTFGRQYDTLIDSIQRFSAPSWAGWMSSHIGDIDDLGLLYRINNAAKYVTPTLGGIRFSALYSFGGLPGSMGRNQVWSLGMSYESGNFGFGAGYLNARDPNVSFYGNTPNKGLSTANNIGSVGSTTVPESFPTFAGYASANTLEIMGLGGNYTFGGTTISGVLTNTRFDSLGSSSGPNPFDYSGNVNFTNIELDVREHITTTLQTGIAFDYTRRSSLDSDGGAKYMQLDMLADYALSRRTDVYLEAILQRASGRDSLGQSAVATIGGFTPSSTNKQAVVRIGLRQRF
ncbi:porin [Paraburkholderia megapolitana]|uniref:porin n=1 Tax=Paraburkholderia megapolitana TaxID=420953 RepID=UPI0038BA3041